MHQLLWKTVKPSGGNNPNVLPWVDRETHCCGPQGMLFSPSTPCGSAPDDWVRLMGSGEAGPGRPSMALC